MITKLVPIRTKKTLEWEARDLRERLTVIDKTFTEVRAQERSLLSRLRTASIRVRGGKETRVLHKEEDGRKVYLRVRKGTGSTAQKEELRRITQAECNRIGYLVATLESALDITPPAQKGLVGGRVRYALTDPVLDKAYDTILKFLQEKGGTWRKASLIEATGIGDKLFRRAIAKLIGEGHVAKEGSRRMMTYKVAKKK
jgi:hypothetical protein